MHVEAEKVCLIVNPARAGMIRSAMMERCVTRCKPRASGDDPIGIGLIPNIHM